MLYVHIWGAVGWEMGKDGRKSMYVGEDRTRRRGEAEGQRGCGVGGGVPHGRGNIYKGAGGGVFMYTTLRRTYYVVWSSRSIRREVTFFADFLQVNLQP